MRDLYPEIEPHRVGTLAVGEGHELYWEECGNPDGKPAVFLHGGPGGGCSPAHRRMFDPARYRIVLFDQRGTGRSTPHAGGLDADFTHNTTWHLVADIEALREHLGIERWQVFGGSWGSTLALAYAQSHPERVTELVLRGIFLSEQREFDWGFGEYGAASLFPDRREALIAPVPEQERHDVLAAYERLLWSPDPAVRAEAAIAWVRWEAATAYLRTNDSFVAAMTEPEHAAAMARIEVHFFRNRCFLAEGQLLRDAHRLHGIPGVIAHGRYDVVTTPTSAWQLHRAWPDSELHLVEAAGHAFDEPGIADVLLAATDRFA